MYVLAVVGSPRKGGNTDVLVDRVLEGAASVGADARKVYLGDLDIAPCRGCLSCERTGECVQRDDMAWLYDEVVRADALVLGTPVYWWGPSAQLKVFVDRWYALIARKDSLAGKRVVVVAPYADSDPGTPRHLFGMMEESLEYLGMTLQGTLGVTASDIGDAAGDEAGIRRAFELGRSLCSG
ncbi:MAG: flavodoxin family protein [Firmicutes bacterium]|jgi:multimeric flavodoxin WrbA|nr:flavodoxin family protein [Bacillota bacterium]